MSEECTERDRLVRLTLRGFKSIGELRQFEPRAINVLIGPNGAGKSNFLSFFRMLAWALQPPNGLALHVGQSGGAQTFLHDGPGTTPELEAKLVIESENGLNEYEFALRHAAGDTLVYTYERMRFSRHGQGVANWIDLGSGHREPRLVQDAEQGRLTALALRNMLRGIKVFQFHNTSQTARMRGKWDAGDGRWFREDGANLASTLVRIRDQAPGNYDRILTTLRSSLPFFSEFVFEPEYDKLLLKWLEQGSDYLFDASQASDGMLRLIALSALLLRPADDLPNVILIDEPELGLHPFAIEQVAGMIDTASRNAQVVVSTQSVALLDYFEPDDVVVVDRKDRATSFSRLEAKKLESWLDEYSLSELWEMNILGGRPAR